MFFLSGRTGKGGDGHGADKLTSRAKIIAVLRQLKSEHELLSAQVNGQAACCNTAILGVREKEGIFFLDELSDPASHEAFLKHGKLRVDCRLQGMELHFMCKLNRADTSGGIALYEVGIPKVVHRLQRRQHFRVRLNPGTSIAVSVPCFEGETLSGEAFDLSAGGLGAFFRTRNIPNPGQIMNDCTIPLPRYKPIKTRLEVRFAKLDGAHHRLRLGGRFVGLDRRQERLLAQFLAEMQRKRRRFGS